MVTKAEVESFLETEEGKELIQPKIDKAVSKGLNTFKTLTLPGLIEEAVVKAHPAETAAEKRLRQIETELAQEKKARSRESQKSKIVAGFATNGIPLELADYVIGETEEDTANNIISVSTSWNAAMTKAVETKLGKDSGRNPDNNVVDIKDIDGQIKVATEARNVSEVIRLQNLKLKK